MIPVGVIECQKEGHREVPLKGHAQDLQDQQINHLLSRSPPKEDRNEVRDDNITSYFFHRNLLRFQCPWDNDQ